MTGRDVLVRTRRLFTGGHWIRGYFFTKDKEGVDRYCLIGGLRQSAFGGMAMPTPRSKDSWGAYNEAKHALIEVTGTYELMSFNDGNHSPEPVIAAIDKAIEHIDKHRDDFPPLFPKEQTKPDSEWREHVADVLSAERKGEYLTRIMEGGGQ